MTGPDYLRAVSGELGRYALPRHFVNVRATRSVATRFDKLSAPSKFGGNLLAFFLGCEFPQLLG
jgi:hypothetical protein